MNAESNALNQERDVIIAKGAALMKLHTSDRLRYQEEGAIHNQHAEDHRLRVAELHGTVPRLP